MNQAERVSDIFTRIITRVMSPDAGCPAEDITPVQLHAMRHIAQHGTCTVGCLAEGLSVTQPASTMLIDRMVKRELVRRDPGRSDRRQSELTLTPHGHDLLARVEAERTERLSGILDLMSPKERDAFIRSLEGFIAAALKFDRGAGEAACLRCGTEHTQDCIVNRLHRELSGENMDKV